MSVELICKRCEKVGLPVKETARCEWCGGELLVRELASDVETIRSVLIGHGIHPTTLAVKIAQGVMIALTERKPVIVTKRAEYVVHPSQIRDCLRRLGYALFDVSQDKQLSDFEADNALHLAIVGGPEFERRCSGPTSPPLREIVLAEEVGDGWLVTLACGHKKAVQAKRAEYTCLECQEQERQERKR